MSNKIMVKIEPEIKTTLKRIADSSNVTMTKLIKAELRKLMKEKNVEFF